MNSLFDVISDLKLQAKNQRDRGLPGYPRAVARAAEAIRNAEQGLAQSSVPEARSRLAKELADCHGLVGGIQRRWSLDGPADEREPHLVQSIAAYDAGYRYESDPLYGIVNSYNLLNRLTSRILLRPDALDSPGVTDFGHGLTPIDLQQELETASGILKDQLSGPRKGDYWAMADLALVEVLLNLVPARVAYSGFIAAPHETFVLTSVLDGLEPLSRLPIRAAPVLQDAAGLVRSLFRS